MSAKRGNSAKGARRRATTRWALSLLLIAVSGCQWGPRENHAYAVAAVGDLPHSGVLAVSRMIKSRPANRAAGFMGMGAPRIEDQSLLILFIDKREVVGRAEIPGVLSHDVTFDPKSTSSAARLRIGRFDPSNARFDYYEVTRAGIIDELPQLQRSVEPGGCVSGGAPSIRGIVIQPSGEIVFDELARTQLSQCRVYQKDF